MATTLSIDLMTVDEFLALPDDGMERMLIQGILWEKPMTRRNRWHSWIEARIAYLLWVWLETQPRPRGQVFSGEVGCLLRRSPNTVVGIDVAYFSDEIASREPADTRLVDGPPLLAVEILSPSDKLEEVTARVDEYLAVVVPVVWVVDPHFQTVTVYRPSAPPEMFTGERELTAEPHLPGFRTTASTIFTR